MTNCNELTNDKYYYYATSITGEHDQCIKDCSNTDKPFTYGDICKDICPLDRKFYVKEFIHGETDTRKKCLNDCPEQYPYYIIRTDSTDSSKQYYECQATCNGFYVPNEDINKIGKLCLLTCPDGDYKYHIISHDTNIKKCYINCPTEALYHFEGAEYANDKNCYNNCPETHPFHESGSYICRNIDHFTTSGIILYDKKEWTTSITACPTSYKYKSISNNVQTQTICSNECIPEYGEYLTPYNTCVRDCQTSNLVTGLNLKNNEETKKCVCKNLYYIKEDTFEISCFSDSISLCKDTGGVYIFPLKETKQCLKSCLDRIISPSEDECYGGNTCNVYSNTKLITENNGQKKCECAYKYYYNGNKKICLGKYDFCPAGKSKLIPNTMECVSSCPPEYPYTFKDYCITELQYPEGSIINTGSKECECNDKFWIENSPGNYICLEGMCRDEYPVYVESTKQCLKTCKLSFYPVLFENKCYKDCNSITGVNNLEIMPIESAFAEYKCDCLSPWYYDDTTHLLAM